MIERNITLDYTKLILSFLVVAIHNPIFTELPFISNLISNGIARIAVPCFFVINGLYLSKVLETSLSVRKYIKKIFKFYLIWMLIYSPFYLFGFKDTIEKSVVLNIISVFFGYWHLWYLIGLIGGVWLLYIFKQKKIKDKNIIAIALIFFFVGWSFQQARLLLPDASGSLGSLVRANFYSRNFIFMGFPFITMGYYLNKGTFNSLFKRKKLNFFFPITASILILSIEVIAHYFMVYKVGFDFYLILIILCPILIYKLLDKAKIVTVESDYISKLSTVIYFIHPLIIFLLQKTFPSMHGTRLFILILFFSFLFGSALIDANKKLKLFF